MARLIEPEREAPAAGLQDEAWWTFAALPVHARLARVWLAGWLEQRCPETAERVFDALVAFSDVLAGAVLHEAGPVGVHVQLRAGRLLCEVRDAGVDLPALLEADLAATHRRGLSLAAALTTALSVRAAPGGGKILAFTVDLARADTAPADSARGARPPHVAA